MPIYDWIYENCVKNLWACLWKIGETYFSTCHPTATKRGFVKGEALRLLRTNFSKALFEEKINNFKERLIERGYPKNFVENVLSEVRYEEREQSLTKKQKEPKRILPFVTQFHPAVPNLKQILMSKWHFIQRQPLLREIFEPPIISYRRGRSKMNS